MKNRTIGRSAPVAKQAPGSKIGMTSLGNRAVAQAAEPQGDTGAGQNRASIYTYFTKVPVAGETTPILYNGDRLWTRVILTLETAGPVAVGTASALVPVLSGKGQLLETGVPTAFTIAKGNRLYIAATAVNRVKVVLEPVPWLEQITATLLRLVGGGR